MYIKEYYVKKWKSNNAVSNDIGWFSVDVFKDGVRYTDENYEHHTIEIIGLTKYKVSPYYQIKKTESGDKYDKKDPNLSISTFLHYKEVESFDDKYNEVIKVLNNSKHYSPIQWESWLLVEEYGKIFNVEDTEKTYTNYEPYKVLLSKHRQKDESGNDEEYIGNIVDFKDGNIVKIIIHTYFKFKVSEREQIMYGVDEKELKKKWLFMTDYYVSIVNKNTHYNKKYFYRNERYGDPNDPKVYERYFNV